MTQLNTPYPSTAYITGFLRSRGVDAVQADLALALVLKLFSPAGLESVRSHALAQPEAQRTASVHAFLDQFARYRATIGLVIAFLQGRDSTLAHRIAARELLPEGPRFAALEVYADAALSEEGGDPLAWAFGALGVQDKARHIATLYLNDLADVLRDAVDERFAFVRYAESLASSQPTFEPMAAALAAPFTLVDEILHTLTLAIGALSRRALRRAAHCADHQGAEPTHHHCARWRLCEHRAARTRRAPGVRPGGFCDAGFG